MTHLPVRVYVYPSFLSCMLWASGPEIKLSYLREAIQARTNKLSNLGPGYLIDRCIDTTGYKYPHNI